MKRRSAIIAIVAAALFGAGVLVAANSQSDSNRTQSESKDSSEAIAAQQLSTAEVRKGDLSEERDFTSKVTFGDAFDAPVALTGTITSQHSVGSVVGFGESLISVNNKPVFLAEGATPLYRDLFRTNTKTKDEFGVKVQHMEGDDVRQLQAFLNTTRAADKQLEIDGVYGTTTEKAVKAWQKSVGFGPSGRIDSSQLVFSPGPVRIASESRVGATFSKLQISAAEAVATIDTNNRDRSALPVDSNVVIELPDGARLVGLVTKQKQVVKEDGSTVWRTTVTADGTFPGNVTSTKVIATIVVAKDVIHAPVGALIALAEGGFAVEVSNSGTTSLVPVEVGEVLDGRAEVRGEVKPGDMVVVPV